MPTASNKMIKEAQRMELSTLITMMERWINEWKKSELFHLKKKKWCNLPKAKPLVFLFALVVLLLAFGGVVAAAIPLMIGIVTVVTTMGVVYFFHPYTELSIFILNVIPMIGLALSIDFALLFINRFKEEIQTKSVEQAIKITIQTAGRSVIFSGLCVFIGLAGMLFIQVDIFQNVALGGMAVVLLLCFQLLRCFLPYWLY